MRTPVSLNVYNMYWLNKYTSHLGLGVYHSGVEVFGKEYAYAGHTFDFTGVFSMLPKDEVELGEGFTFKETVVLGLTDFSERDVEDLVQMLGNQYLGNMYHLIKRNCNHFSNEFTKLLCGKDIPRWVNRLAAIGIRFPSLAACIPKDWLTPDGDPDNGYVDLTEWEQICWPTQTTTFTERLSTLSNHSESDLQIFNTENKPSERSRSVTHDVNSLNNFISSDDVKSCDVIDNNCSKY